MKLILLIVAVLLFLLAALGAHGTIHGLEVETFKNLGLASFAGSFLPIRGDS